MYVSPIVVIFIVAKNIDTRGGTSIAALRLCSSAFATSSAKQGRQRGGHTAIARPKKLPGMLEPPITPTGEIHRRPNATLLHFGDRTATITFLLHVFCKLQPVCHKINCHNSRRPESGPQHTNKYSAVNHHLRAVVKIPFRKMFWGGLVLGNTSPDKVGANALVCKCSFGGRKRYIRSGL